MSAAESTVREDIDAAVKEIEAKDAPVVETPEVESPAETETKEATSERARDEKGRFVARGDSPAEPGVVSASVGDQRVGGEPETPAAPEVAAPTEPAPAVALAPPNGWSAEAKAKWHELPPEIMAAVQKREQDVAKFTSKSDEERSFGRDVYRAVQPYMAQIQAEGGTPVSAIQSLLNTAYVLRTGSPEQKRQLLLQAAQQYGVDLGTAQPSGQAAPEIETLQQRIDRLERERQQEKLAADQRLQAEVQTEIQAFAADPKHQHYEAVKGHMAALIAQGLAKDLQDAYEQAVWAKPDIRATLEAQRRAEEEQKRRAEAAAKAKEAQRKNIGITGGPGNTAASSAPASKGSVRDDIEAAMAAHSGGV